MDELTTFAGKCLVALGAVFIITCVAAVPAWLLWNWVGPAVFGLPPVTLWQAWGILMLTRLVIPKQTIKEPKT